MLKLDDIFALAKQGYKPSDIKELIELSKEAEVKAEELPDQEIETQKDNKDDQTPSHTVAPEDGKTSEDSEDSKIVDYKKKVEELEKKISDLQKANTQKSIADTGDKKSDSEVIADLMKSFM